MTDESAERARLEELADIENAGTSPPHVKVLRSDYNWLIRLARRAFEDTGERDRLEADLGNEDAWRRYHRARDEVEALRGLCRDIVEELRLGGASMFARGSWQRRLMRAAASERLANERIHDDGGRDE